MTRILSVLGWILCILAVPAFAQERTLQTAKPSASAQQSGSQGRVALVIGNGAYPDSPLRNPVNDARAMAERLRALGFDVIVRENAGRDQMQLAVREFGRRLEQASVGLFYFAGHGMQIKGRNYLIPVDAAIEHEDEVAYRSLDAGEVLDKMETARTRTNLLVLDACRNNPFQQKFRSRRQGLAEMEAPSGTLIAFATAPGAVALDGDGSNGVYTKHMLKQMNEPLPVELMFKRVRVGVSLETSDTQIPWESSSLREDFFFRAPSNPALAAPAEPNEMVLELAFWDAIKNSSNPRDYSAYLDQYPKGRFATLARVRYEELGKVRPVPPQAAAPGAMPEKPLPQKPAAAAPPAAPAAPVSSSMLTSVGFSSDGRWLVLTSSDGSARIVNAATGFVLKRFVVGFGPSAASFSPDGSMLAFGGAGGELALFDVARGAEIRRQGGHKAAVVATAFSPEGRYIISGAADGEVLLRALRTGETVKRYDLGPATLRDLQYAPDGRYFAAVQGEAPLRRAKVIDVSNGREVLAVEASAASFSVNGRFILLATKGNVPTLVEIGSGRELRRFAPQASEIVRGTYSEDGTRVMTLDTSGAAVLWGTLSGDKVAQLQATNRTPRSIAFSPDARTVALVDGDGKLGIHRLKDERK